MNAVVILTILVILCLKWSLAPRRTTSVAFTIYKSLVVLAAWAAFLLSSSGVMPAFAGASTSWLLLSGAVLFSLPTLIFIRTPPRP